MLDGLVKLNHEDWRILRCLFHSEAALSLIFSCSSNTQSLFLTSKWAYEASFTDLSPFFTMQSQYDRMIRL